MKIKKREDIIPIHLCPGDEIELVDGDTNTVVLNDKIGKEITVDQALIFEVEKSDFDEDVRGGIGGAFLETHKKMK